MWSVLEEIGAVVDFKKLKTKKKKKKKILRDDQIERGGGTRKLYAGEAARGM